MVRFGRAVALALVVVLASPVVVGCSSDATLDSAGTSREVERVIGSRVEVDVDRVTCPDTIERGTGRSFTCTAVLADGAGRVRLKVTQVDDGASLSIALRDAVIDKQDAARQLHRKLVQRYRRGFTVDCGAAGPVVVEPGTTFPCTARYDGGTRKVEASVVDAAGTYRFDVG